MSLLPGELYIKDKFARSQLIILMSWQSFHLELCCLNYLLLIMLLLILLVHRLLQLIQCTVHAVFIVNVQRFAILLL